MSDMVLVMQHCSCRRPWQSTPDAVARHRRCPFCGSRNVVSGAPSILDVARAATARRHQYGFLFRVAAILVVLLAVVSAAPTRAPAAEPLTPVSANAAVVRYLDRLPISYVTVSGCVPAGDRVVCEAHRRYAPTWVTHCAVKRRGNALVVLNYDPDARWFHSQPFVRAPVGGA